MWTKAAALETLVRSAADSVKGWVGERVCGWKDVGETVWVLCVMGARCVGVEKDEGRVDKGGH
jgi:hypothetical protein